MIRLQHEYRWARGRYVCALAALTLTVAVSACCPRPTVSSDTSEAAAPPDAATSKDFTPGEVKAATVADIEALMQAAEGKVTVVNFWATWCVPCVAEMPELAEFYHEHSREDVALIAISLDLVDDMEDTVKPFMKDKKVPFPAYVLSERDIDAVSEAMGQEIHGALPTTLVYDRRGQIQKMWERAITLDELNAEVKPLL